MSFEFTQMTQILVHFFSSLIPDKSTQDWKLRFIKGNLLISIKTELPKNVIEFRMPFLQKNKSPMKNIIKLFT